MSELELIDFQGEGYFTYPEPFDTARIVSGLDDESVEWLRAFGEARRGRFESVAGLLNIFPALTSPLLRFTYSQLIGDAGPGSCILSIESQLRDRSNPLDSSTARLFGRILAARGRLADVPLLADIYIRYRTDPDLEILPVFISDLMEPDQDRVCDPAEFFAIEEYREAVKARYEDLRDYFGTDKLYIHEGTRFGVVQLAHKMIHQLREGDFIPEYRQKFEASTGIDCRGFYEDGSLKSLAAAATVEEFLESSQTDKYEEGVRYFFGYQIPD